MTISTNRVKTLPAFTTKLRNTGSARILFIGDSKTIGVGAGTGAQKFDGATKKNKTYQLAQLLRASGYAATTDSFFGYQGMASPTAYMAYNPAVTGITTWAGAAISLGGSTFIADLTPLSFQPDLAYNKVTVYFRDQVGSIGFSISNGIDVAQNTTVTAPSSPISVKQEFTFATTTTNPVVLTKLAAGTMSLIGVELSNTAIPSISILNIGISGSTTNTWIDYTDRSRVTPTITLTQPDLTIINLGTNDLNGGAVTLATYLTNIQGLITEAKKTGDVILTWPAISGVSPAGGTDANRLIWKQELNLLADKTKSIFVDEEALLGGRAATLAGSYFVDALHEKVGAYGIEALNLHNIILSC